MLHWDNIQVGDVLEWTLGATDRYEIVSKTKYGFGWNIGFKDLKTNKVYPDYREGAFNYARLFQQGVVPSKEQLILEKIKYLNSRFNERKHVCST